MDEFRFSGFLWRLAFSLALVFLTFNPSGHSYYHWLADGFPQVQPLEAIAGILLLALWIFFVRSTLLAPGAVGVILLSAWACPGRTCAGAFPARRPSTGWTPDR